MKILSERKVLSLASYSSAYAATADEGFFRSRIHPVVAELTRPNLRYNRGRDFQAISIRPYNCFTGF